MAAGTTSCRFRWAVQVKVRGGVKFGGSEVRGESAHEYLQANVFTITTLTN